MVRVSPVVAGVIGVGLVAVIGAAAAAGNPVATSPFVRATPSAVPSGSPTPRFDPNTRGLNDEVSWLAFIVGALVLLAVVVSVVMIIVLTIRMFSGRHSGLLRRRVLEPDEIELLVTPLPDVDLMGLGAPVVDAVRGGLVDVVSGSDVRTGIIAAWLRLEDAAATVGTPRRDTDAPGDLVQRLLATHAVGPAALERLAEFYRRARFSRAPLTELDRSAAISALSAVQVDLLGEPVGAGDAGADVQRWPTRWN